MDRLPEVCDVVVVGGGPAGTTCAHLLAKAGFDVVVLERSRHPRFCIGESLLPCTTRVWERLGLIPKFEEAGFIQKYGAYFCFADGDDTEYFHFGNAAFAQAQHAYEVPRDQFDKVLWDAAVEAGAACFDQTRVTRFNTDGDRITGVTVTTDDGEHTISARLTLDCAGRATLLGKQLGLREPDPVLDQVALFAHYDDVILAADEDAGTIGIVATDWGWMWFIPFSGGRASVGAVAHSAQFKLWKKEGLDREGIWARILGEVRAVRGRVAHATQSRPVEVKANFSFRCRELAGDGWVLVGDSGAFLDPVFSSGVHLAMCGAEQVADLAVRALRGGRVPVARDFRPFERRSRAALAVFSKFIYAWYDDGFRKVFMQPPDRPGVRLLKKHIISLLAGDVFNRAFALPPLYLLLFFARLGPPPTR
ncbi:MAG: NAD(P)/FAD-dependent oxidoreductase [Proteobacteria bacterium]|nr:NAD(P)/FAD-dependent oxidoreductase [Pseudomonadota bacterium]